MAELWAEYGFLAYAVAFFWAFFEGETFVIVAAAAGKATGAVDPVFLFFSVWIGSFCGDQVWFWAGRKWGRKALKRMPAAEAKVDKALVLLERHGTVFILGFRFIYGVRNVASLACGASGITWRRFAALNLAGAAVWAASFVLAGWYLAAAFGENGVLWFFGAIGAVVLGVLIWRAIRNRPRRPRVASAAGNAAE